MAFFKGELLENKVLIIDLHRLIESIKRGVTIGSDCIHVFYKGEYGNFFAIDAKRGRRKVKFSISLPSMSKGEFVETVYRELQIDN